MHSDYDTPKGLSRRHFLQHMAGASALSIPALSLTRTLMANEEKLRRNHKSAILMWMGGGPPTIDIWDLKPGAVTGGPIKPISTAGDMQISELMPEMAKKMDKVSLVRSMSTREADHGRGRYYMHTGYVPNPNIEHPSYGAVVAHEMLPKVPELEIPPFVSVGGGSVGPGFLGMSYAPFTVGSNGNVRNVDMGMDKDRVMERMRALASLEKDFIGQDRGSASVDHAKILEKTLALMTSEQMKAFKVAEEPQEVRDKYGADNFGQGCLMARRLVETGVPFVEVNLGGWDLHGGCFTTLQTKLPPMDQSMAALITDLEERDLLKDTVVIWMGEFGRTPRINGNAGRDHWARSWSVMVGGGNLKGGIAVGETSADGTRVESEPYTAQDLMATVCRGLGISLETTFTSKNGRPMKIANSGKVIKELVS